MGISDKIKNAKMETSLFEDISEERMFALKMQARIAVAIHRERKKREMSQAQFAAFMGVSQAMVSKWESGEYNFSVAAWAELSHKLSIPFDPEATMEKTSEIIAFPWYYGSRS